MAPPPKFDKETELAEGLIAYLKTNGYEVFQEVQDSWGSGAIDVVARKDNMNWAIECKLNFNLDVLAQAFSNKKFSDYVSICVPSAKWSRSRDFAITVARQFGIGVIEIGKRRMSYGSEQNNHHVFEKLKPALNVDIRPLKLMERQKDYATAGSNEGKFWSEFKETSVDVIKYVTDNGPTHLKVIMANVKHHYANQRSAIATFSKRIRGGAIPELIVDENVVSLAIIRIKWESPEDDQLEKDLIQKHGSYNKEAATEFWVTKAKTDTEFVVKMIGHNEYFMNLVLESLKTVHPEKASLMEMLIKYKPNNES